MQTSSRIVEPEWDRLQTIGDRRFDQRHFLLKLVEADTLACPIGVLRLRLHQSDVDVIDTRGLCRQRSIDTPPPKTGPQFDHNEPIAGPQDRLEERDPLEQLLG